MARDVSNHTTMRVSNPAHQAYQILHWVFFAVPLVAGLDKFAHVLVNWSIYLNPIVPRLTGLAPHNFMYIVGVVEIIAAVIVAIKPSYGGYIVMAWLWAIVLNLLVGHGYYDIALRDLGLSFGALALARLSVQEEHA